MMLIDYIKILNYRLQQNIEPVYNPIIKFGIFILKLILLIIIFGPFIILLILGYKFIISLLLGSIITILIFFFLYLISKNK